MATCGTANRVGWCGNWSRELGCFLLLSALATVSAFFYYYFILVMDCVNSLKNQRDLEKEQNETNFGLALCVCFWGYISNSSNLIWLTGSGFFMFYLRLIQNKSKVKIK